MSDCRLCGDKNVSPSMGGADICPSCDCGIDPKIRHLEAERDRLNSDLDASGKIYAEALKEIERLNEQFQELNDGDKLVILDIANDRDLWKSKAELLVNQNGNLLIENHDWKSRCEKLAEALRRRSEFGPMEPELEEALAAYEAEREGK